MQGTSIVGVHCGSMHVLIKLLSQIKECIFVLLIVGNGFIPMHKEFLIQGVSACPFIPAVSLRWAVFIYVRLLNKKFELNFCNFLRPSERDHVCIPSYIPTKICHDQTSMLLLLSKKANVLEI